MGGRSPPLLVSPNTLSGQPAKRPTIGLGASQNGWRIRRGWQGRGPPTRAFPSARECLGTVLASARGIRRPQWRITGKPHLVLANGLLQPENASARTVSFTFRLPARTTMAGKPPIVPRLGQWPPQPQQIIPLQDRCRAVITNETEEPDRHRQPAGEDAPSV